MDKIDWNVPILGHFKGCSYYSRASIIGASTVNHFGINLTKINENTLMNKIMLNTSPCLHLLEANKRVA